MWLWRRRKFWTCGLILYVWITVGQLPSAFCQTLELRQSLFVAGDTAASQSPQAQSQRLPDRWRESRPTFHGTGWYEFHFQRTHLGPGVQAVYLPHASVNAAVYLNGKLLGSGGSFDEPISRTWNRPRIYLVPIDGLANGNNALSIALKGHPYAQASMFPPVIGPEAEMREIYESAYFWRITVNQFAGVLVAVVSLLMLNFWWRRRQDVAYGYFAASALVWSLQSTNLYLIDIPVTTTIWEIAVNASFQIFSSLLLMSMLRFVNAGWRPLERVMLAVMVLSPLAMLLAPASKFLTVTMAMHLCTLAYAVFSLTLLLRSALKHKNHDARMLLGTLGLIVVLAIHDWLLHSEHLWFAGQLDWLPSDLYLLQYSAPLIFLAIGWIMTLRFIHALNAFEALSVELDQRVSDKRAQLEESFARLRDLERERAIHDERERILSDLHDDVGAKLLTLVYRADSREAADIARSALQDLRDVVSRSGITEMALEDALADWHAESEQRLSAASVALEWQQSGDLDAVRLTQPQVLNLGRILREAISNIIKHSGAGQVAVSITRDAASLRLEWVDNGVGLDPNARPSGRGLANIQARARAIGAKTEQFHGTTGGYGMRVWVPLAHRGAGKTDQNSP